MAAQRESMGRIEREAVYRIREAFAQGREAVFEIEDAKERSFVSGLSELALYPEKPLLSFLEKQEESRPENIWNPEQTDTDFFRRAEMFWGKPDVRKLIICGGVDDGKSTLIGRILFDTKPEEEQDAIRMNPEYLRKDDSVDYALLAGASEEETRQGITVQVSYSAFDWNGFCFLMADVPGHEEYTRNMAFAASGADTAVILTAANKGIVPQTRRHMRICYFMGIRSMIFAVNKMDMVSYEPEVFFQLCREIEHMMEEYEGCHIAIVPVAAKGGVNIIGGSGEEMPWYQGGTLLEALKDAREKKEEDGACFCMPVQRTCKSSQMKGAVIKTRVIQGEVVSGGIQTGDEVFVYPTAGTARVSALYCLKQERKEAVKGEPVGIELDRELDVARGYILTDKDVLTVSDRIEADLLWTSDDRLTQGKRYLVQAGTVQTTAAVTKICYQTDVNTGEHRYAEYLTKNALARCELCFPKQIAAVSEQENHVLGTIRLFDRETRSLAAYGNIVHTISKEAWKENVGEVTPEERELALGQKAGLILFGEGEKGKEIMNYAERYLLSMGFHTIQVPEKNTGGWKDMIRRFLDAGLIVLLLVLPEEKEEAAKLFQEPERIFDCTHTPDNMGNMGGLLKKMKRWASELI